MPASRALRRKARAASACAAAALRMATGRAAGRRLPVRFGFPARLVGRRFEKDAVAVGEVRDGRRDHLRDAARLEVLGLGLGMRPVDPGRLPRRQRPPPPLPPALRMLHARMAQAGEGRRTPAGSCAAEVHDARRRGAGKGPSSIILAGSAPVRPPLAVGALTPLSRSREDGNARHHGSSDRSKRKFRNSSPLCSVGICWNCSAIEMICLQSPPASSGTERYTVCQVSGSLSVR